MGKDVDARAFTRRTGYGTGRRCGAAWMSSH